ncbi:hypothetical protein N8I77_005686 [Diaporthe amygdali]|uniref:Glyceraldehyde 3-phosphate dehydrogenase NAD(P) binding domain-containing protein n=1 Tax=Phomopsis amygdali TaxID=1214568 RepID=A0AAD9W5U4_PHOAM|nr:hypothetical protein N8I77_005686 [Diaporthe amygdali]
MDEFPGDNPDNIPEDEDHFDLPRSPAKVLDELGHTFRVGINGFGSLGRAVFCKALNRPHIEIVAVNDPHVDAMKAAYLLQKELAEGRIGRGGLEIHAETPDILRLRDSTMGKTKTVLFSSESDPSIKWQDPQRRVLHIIECSGKFTTVEQASAHIHTAYHTANDDARGALKVLIATATTDAPRFYPGINLRDYRVEQSIFACAPPGGDTGTINDDAWEYASHVLDLLSLALARDGAAASFSVMQEEGNQGEVLPGGESLFVNCLRHNLTFFLPPNFRSDWFGGEVEMGNSEFMYIWYPCTCCRRL